MPTLHSWGLSDWSNAIDDQYRKRASRTYEFVTSEDADDVWIRNNCGVGLYSPHVSDPSLLCVGISVEGGAKTREPGIGNPVRIFDVTFDYSTFDFIRAPGGPLSQPAVWSMVPYLKNEPAYRDWNGVPIINTAGDPFNPPIEYERICYTLTVTRNEADPNFSAIQLMGNKTNAGQWLIFPEKTAKSMPSEVPERQYDNESNQFYHTMKYTFDIDPDDWMLKVLNQGFREKKNNKLIKIIDESGDPIDDPVLLDNNGAKLVYPVTTSSIIIKKFDILQPIPFSGFGMDTIFQ